MNAKVFGAVLCAGVIVSMTAGCSHQAPAAQVQVKEVTPDVCVRALDEADRSFGLLARSLAATAEGDFAASQGYLDQLDADSYNRDKAACRAAHQSGV